VSAIHYDPLRPHRARGIADRWEFTHGTDSICVYDIASLALAKEIPVGERPDCHATSCDNRWLYVACKAGLYVIDQETLEVARRVDTGWVFGTNVMPDGSTMLLHDATGGILVLRDIGDPLRIRVERRLDVLGTNTEMDTLGGKGNFVEPGRYLCCGWKNPRLYAVNPGAGPSWSLFLEDPRLAMSDDLVVSGDRSRAYAACHGGRGEARVVVVGVARRAVVGTIPTGAGTCGLTMSDDERFAIASADADEAIAIIDTRTDAVAATLSARPVLAAAGIRGYLQGISARGADVYVYGCSGNGALAVFHGLGPGAEVTVTWPGGLRRGKAEVS
jgi:hypothetical protein